LELLAASVTVLTIHTADPLRRESFTDTTYRAGLTFLSGQRMS
jgi:hypothetical protein